MDKVIDGVDVSGCKYYHYKGCTANNFGKCDGSSDIYKNCYYKQLKRKEQECEKLNNQYCLSTILKINELEQENERLKANKGRCAFKCLDNTFCPEADKKITELELSRDSYKVNYETAKKYREKAEKALQEIRDIINAPCDNCKYNKDGITCSISDCGEGKLKIIENKINEVIGAE